MRTTTLAAAAAVALAASAALAGCATSSGSPTGLSADAVIGTWVVDEAFPQAPETPYLALQAEDAWVGSDGCNTTTGTWTLEPDGAVAVEAGPSTLIYCEGAPLSMLFAGADSLSLDGGTLTIHGADGVETALVRSDDPNVGPQDPVGLWGSQDPQQPWLELAEDGSLTGSDGCNTLTGTWEGDGSRVDFGAIASTRMACEGVDTWLSAAGWATLQGGVMTVATPEGTVIGQLSRTS